MHPITAARMLLVEPAGYGDQAVPRREPFCWESDAAEVDNGEEAVDPKEAATPSSAETPLGKRRNCDHSEQFRHLSSALVRIAARYASRPRRRLSTS